MSARVNVKSCVILDELALRMRRTAARLGVLARRHVRSNELAERAGDAALALRGVSALAPAVPQLAPVAEELAAGLAGAELPPGVTAGDASAVALALLECASSARDGADRAAKWVDYLAGMEGGAGSLGALALARFAAATGEARFGDAARQAMKPSEAGGPGPEAALETLLAARGQVALAAAEAPDGESVLASARGTHERLARERFPPAGGFAPPGVVADPDGSRPAVTAEWIGLSCDLWRAERRARYLDAAEAALLNRALFEQTDDGGAARGRRPEGECGSVDDNEATPALARGLAAAAELVLTSGPGDVLVAGFPANALAVLSVDGRCEVRCIVSTQMPVRGWTRWTFQPASPAGSPAGSPAVSSATQRSGRRRRMVPASAEAPARPDAAAPAFGFRVRVPAWSGGAAPQVKVNKQRANVKPAEGFLHFEVPADRATEIEVVLAVRPGLIERESAASWAREVALSHGPLVLTASAELNPGGVLGQPLRITSEAGELTLVADVRRRLPVVRARASSGGQACPVLFSALSEVGGLTEGLGGVQPVSCVPFRTWHRWGK